MCLYEWSASANVNALLQLDGQCSKGRAQRLITRAKVSSSTLAFLSYVCTCVCVCVSMSVEAVSPLLETCSMLPTNLWYQ